MNRADFAVKLFYTRFLFGSIGVLLMSLLSPTEAYSLRAVRICVIDSGLSPDVPALQRNLMAPFNALTDTNNPHEQLQNIVDLDGHGTATSGIIRQLTPKSILIPVKSFELGIGTTESLQRGLTHCLHQHADIVNISSSGHELVKKFILDNSPMTQNTLFVMAAGNFKEQILKDTQRPNNLLLVGALTLSVPAKITSYSASGEGVDLYAPAGDNNEGLETWTIKNERRLYNGTSAAAPVVSANAALLKEQQPDISIADLRNLLTTIFKAF